MESRSSLSIGYIGALILAVLSCLSPVSSRTVGAKTEKIVDPLTLEHHAHSRHKRNIACQDLECRSLCPWTWVHDSEDGRQPRSIFKAQCINASCDFDFAGLGSRAQRRLQLHTECDLVYTDIKVWQNDYPAWIPWPIACACSKPRSRTVTRHGDSLVMSVLRHRLSNTGVRAIDAIPAAGRYGGYDGIDAIPAAGGYGGYDAIDARPAARSYWDYDSMDAISAAGSYRGSDDTGDSQDRNIHLMPGRRFRHENNWNFPVRRSRNENRRNLSVRRFRQQNN